jgi:hypothetical protein
MRNIFQTFWNSGDFLLKLKYSELTVDKVDKEFYVSDLCLFTMVFSTLDLRNFSQQVNFSSVSGKIRSYGKDHITWVLKLRNKLKNPKAKFCKVH